jgi:hypothetical protein
MTTERRRWYSRRYVNDVRALQRAYGLTWKQAQEAYRRARQAIGTEKRHGTSRRAIIEAARPAPPVADEIHRQTNYVVLFRLFDDPKYAGYDCRIACDWYEDRFLLGDRVDWVDSYRAFRAAGDDQFDGGPPYSSPSETIWRIEEMFAITVIPSTKTLIVAWPVPPGWGM